MKRLLFLITLMLAPMLANAQTVSDVQNSGCLNKTRGEEPQRVPTIVLKKEGSVLSVEVQNYISNCCTDDFYVSDSISGGSDGDPISVSINVAPTIEMDCDCICPFNLSFTVRDLEPNSFYLKCWWYEGIVELTEGEPLVLEDIWEQITVDDTRYVLRKAMLKAMLADGSAMKGEVVIPSELSHEGQTYTVTSISESAFYNNKGLTKVTIPQTIKSIDFDDSYGFYYNLFSTCTALKSIEVEEGNPVLCSVDGVLFNKEKTSLISYPANTGSTIYNVPGVTRIGEMAFGGCSALQTLDIPESVSQIGGSAFYGCKLDTLYIRGIIESDFMFRSIFNGMGTETVVYVQPSEVDKFKAIYKGPVLPLNEWAEDDYRPMIEDGKVWKLGDRDSGNPVQLVEYYYFDGDTIINGKTCKQMMCQRFISADYPDYDNLSQLPSLSKVGAWYEEDKKVYFYNPIKQYFQIKFDFSIDANDTLRIDNALPCVIGPKQTGGLEGFKGVYRDVMSCWKEELIYNTTWLEGIGSIEGPIHNVYLGEEYYALFLMSCTVGDEVIYLNDEYEDGATPEGARKGRFDFTHTIKIQPKAPIKREKSDACISSSEREVARQNVKAPIKREKGDACISSSEREVARPEVKAPMRRESEQSLYGEYSDLQLGIHLDPLDDAYQVSITNESGKVVYEKTVNAGTIVGLNIDISAYAKGCYTVTIENSSESFTGEFEVQTTGIETVSHQTSAVKHHIYNLQGQRLSSLQKGLNIVNGQKIYVK